MRRFISWSGMLLMLAAALVMTGCGRSVSAQSGVTEASPNAPITVPTATATEAVNEDLSALTPEPTEAPDPAATEYAQAMIATPAPTRTSAPRDQATPDLLKLLEAHANQLTLPPPPDQVNGRPLDSFVVMDAGVIANINEIFAKGQAAGRNPHAFSKAGDSTIETPYFLARFDTSPYKLGAYAYLQAVIDAFKGSFARSSMAVRIGQHSWTVLNPAWADKAQCEPGESPLGCEFRQNNPSILLIRLGANDAGVPKMYEKNMRAVVQYALDNNVIPVLSTKPDQRKGTEGINDIVRKLASEYKIPLWDFDHIAAALPDRGLGPDGVHMTGFYQHDYTLPQAFQRGQGVQNLTALIVLDEVWKALQNR